MRVSVVNLNLVAPDAIGQCILNQVRFFLRRGDDVKVYVMHSPVEVPDSFLDRVEVVSLSGLVASRNMHFHRSDLYVYHYPGRHELMESLPGLDRGAVVFYYHNVTPPEFWDDEEGREHLARSAESVGVFARYADLTVTDSQFNADQLVNDHGCEPDQVMVLPLAVSLGQFTPGPKNLEVLRKHGLGEGPVILFVGRMAGNKRVDLLVEALSYVHKQLPSAKLLLVGDDRGNPVIEQTVAAAKARAADLGIAGRVVFTGRVKDLPGYYRAADVYVSASLHEGFGVPLVEAMASGRPVVASNVAAHPWVLGDAGLLTEPGDPKDIADKLLRVLTDDEFYGELVNRGLTRARQFSLSQYEVGWSEAVMRATEWLPEQPYLRTSSSMDEQSGEGSQPSHQTGGREVGLPSALLREMSRSADIVDREWVTRSGLPIIGPLVVWIRQNLTSHIVAYLQPTFERQVRYNRLVSDALLWLGSHMSLPHRQASHDAEAVRSQLREILQRLDALQARITAIEAQFPGKEGSMDDSRQDAARMREEIDRIHQMLDGTEQNS